MRFYVLSIQYNREKEAENRTAPKGFDKLEEAIAEFHSQLAKDMKNDTLGWSLCMVINSDGGIHKNEKWTREEIQPEPQPEEEN